MENFRDADWYHTFDFNENHELFNFHVTGATIAGRRL